MKVYASKIRKGDTVVLYGKEWPVLDTAREGSTVILWIAEHPFITSNYASFKWNDYVDVVFPDCARCAKNDPHDVPHTNCLYWPEVKVGHSRSHCTADSCY